MFSEPVPAPATFTGSRAAWIDAYITAASAMQPEAKPAAITAAAHAAWPAQGWLLPGMVAYLDAALGPV